MSVDTSETNAETLTLQIEGMHCSCEAGMLERELSCLAGVSSCNVDPISQRARVFFDPSRITTQDIVRSVSAAGMTASLVHEKRQRSTWWKAPQQVALYGCGVTIMLAFVLSLAGAPTLLSNALYVLAVLIGVYYPARKALIALLNLTPTIHLLMLIGSGGAMILGMWAESAILIFVYSLGDVLESYAVDKARGASNHYACSLPSFHELRNILAYHSGSLIALPVKHREPWRTVV